MHRAQTALSSVARHSVALCAALIAALYLAGLRAPMRIGTDAAIQLIPFEQWARGASPTPFHLTTADPAAPTTDRHQWITAWPPALPGVLVAGHVLGLQATTTLRLLNFVSLLLGAFGWLRIARRFDAAPGLTLAFAILLGLRAASAALGAPAYGLRTMDPLAFAAVPWLLLALVAAVDAPLTIARALALGFAAGLMALAKYSALFAMAGALAAFVVLRWPRDRSVAKPLALGAGLASPFAALTLAYVGVTHSSPGRFHAEWAAAHVNPWADILLGALTALGRGVFEVSFPFYHVLVVGSPANRLFPAVGFLDRVRLFMWLGAPLTIAAVWLLARARHRAPTAWWVLITGSAAGVLVLTAVLGAQNQFNYLNDNAARYLACVAPGLELLILRAVWDWPMWRRPLARVAGLALVFAGSAASTAFLLQDVRRAPPGRGAMYALPRGVEPSRELLARVSREAATDGAIVAVSWNDFELPFALSMPNRLFFPLDTVRLRLDARTPIVLIAEPTGSDAPPATALRSFDPSIQWARKAGETDANVGVWHAVFPARGGTP